LTLDGLSEFHDLIKHRWDLMILALLSERPRRRVELTQQVVDEAGTHISDGVLSEALQRLQDEGLVTKHKTGPHHADYHATPLALRKIERLRMINTFVAGNMSDHGEHEPADRRTRSQNNAESEGGSAPEAGGT
jgi:DNA-binding HxlR family transcriptional regulator